MCSLYLYIISDVLGGICSRIIRDIQAIIIRDIQAIIIRDIQAIYIRIYCYKCDVLCSVNCLDVRTLYLGMCLSDVCAFKLLICVLEQF